MARSGALLAFLRLGRFHFLAAGALFFAFGAALAHAAGARLTVAEWVLGLSFVASTQLAVHYANDYHDLAADRANRTPTLLAGGSRVLVEGRIRPEVSLRTSWILFAVAAALLIAFTLQTGPVVVAVGVATLLLSWAYSAPPLRLVSRGIGELAAGTVVAGLVPALALAGAGTLDASTLARLVPGVLQTSAVVAVLSLPDVEGDAAAGKRTLAVRVGRDLAVRALQVLWLLSAVAAGILVLRGEPAWIAAAWGAALLLAAWAPRAVAERRWTALALAAAGVSGLQAALLGAAAVT